jgi:threonine dehydratase
LVAPGAVFTEPREHLADNTAAGLVDHAGVVAARELMSGVLRTTPLQPVRPLSEAVGGPVYLKCEQLQHGGSFKVRGAYVRIARLSEAERSRGVVAASAGNHAQGVALAAGLLGTEATVFMPSGAPLPKVAATQGYGARVELVGSSPESATGAGIAAERGAERRWATGGTVEDALHAARQFAKETGAVFVHPFDHPDVIAGQGTIGLEILEQCPDVRTIVVGVGGGGLVAGIGAAVKPVRPDVAVYGVQSSGAAAFPPSLSVGHPITLDRYATIADGIAVGRPGELTFEHVRAYADDVLTVSDEDISRALLLLLERCKVVSEPAGAAGVAALQAFPERFTPPVVAVLSGGNIDPLLLVKLIEYGLTAAGRYLRFTVVFPDRPGVLASMLDTLAEHRANILDILHQRRDPRLALGEVAVDFSVETRGPEHARELLDALRAAGYTLT